MAVAQLLNSSAKIALFSFGRCAKIPSTLRSYLLFLPKDFAIHLDNSMDPLVTLTCGHCYSSTSVFRHPVPSSQTYTYHTFLQYPKSRHAIRSCFILHIISPIQIPSLHVHCIYPSRQTASQYEAFSLSRIAGSIRIHHAAYASAQPVVEKVTPALYDSRFELIVSFE